MIGIFGGTFDPVHYGHIKPALSIKHALNLTQLLFVPNSIPPHREAPWLSVEQRLSLLENAVEEYPGVSVDERELNREGPSYMVDTLVSLRKDFPVETFCLIIGMDAFIGLSAWHRWRDIFDLCHIVVTQRPGFLPVDIEKRMAAEDYKFISEKITQDVAMLTSEETGVILLQSVPQLDISSTQIREELLKGGDVSQWLPEKICQQLRGFVNESR